jgi:hypothetical protein
MKLNRTVMIAGAAALALTRSADFFCRVLMGSLTRSRVVFYSGAKRESRYRDAGRQRDEINDTIGYGKLIDASYFGGSFEIGDKLTGTFQIGFQGGSQGADDERKVMVRAAFLEYDLGFGSFLAGNQEAPYLRGSSQASAALGNDGMGAIQDGSFHPQLD